MRGIDWRPCGRNLALILVVASSPGLGRGTPADRDPDVAYRVRSVDVAHRVALRGQFDAGFIDAVLDSIVGVSNPAPRRGASPRGPHFVWYRLHEESAEPNRKVILRNQYGEQTWTIGSPVYLMAPATWISSSAPPGAPPDSVDTYKCYRVLSYERTPLGDPGRDRSGRNPGEPAVLRIPRLFAVPVRSQREGRTTTLWDGATHLAIYSLESRPPEGRTVVARDPFGTHSLSVRAVRGLVVPSEKLAWGAVMALAVGDTLTLAPME
jgi:hypothetical protein